MSDMVSHPPTFAPQRPGSNEDLIRSLRDEIARLRADAERMREALTKARSALHWAQTNAWANGHDDTPYERELTGSLERITAALAGDQQGGA